TPSVCTGTGTKSCNLGTLTNGAGAPLAITVKPGPGMINNTFTVAASEPDSVSANNSLTLGTTVPDYSMAATKSPITAFPGAAILLNGTATANNGYANSVNLACAGGGVTCSGSVTPTNTYSLAATAPAASGTTSVVGTGTDGLAISRSASYTLTIVDFNIST